MEEEEEERETLYFLHAGRERGGFTSAQRGMEEREGEREREEEKNRQGTSL